MECDKIVQGQELVCTTCNMRWDLNDNEFGCAQEPMSRQQINRKLRNYSEWLEKFYEDDKNFPSERKLKAYSKFLDRINEE